MSHRVLLASIFHETHTFLEGVTSLEQFQIRRGDELLATEGDGSPLAGVVQVARDRGWTLLPAVDMRATPSATVADAVVDEFCRSVREVLDAESADGLHGVCLVLHGAMAAASYLDVEGEILTRLRSWLGGADVPVCGVFDLHANVTDRMTDGANSLVSYRCNPHTDAHEAAVDAAGILDRLMRSGERPVMLREQPPIVWPPSGTGTDDDPMRTLEAMAREIERQHAEILCVNVAGGFSYADLPETGPSFSLATLGDPQAARAHLRRLADWAIAHREKGNVVPPPLDDVIERVKSHREGPVVLVEPSDNVGGGAPGDGTVLLRTLIRHGIDNAAVVINDPDAVVVLNDLPIGERRTLTLGGRGSPLSGGPAELEVELLSRSDGRFELEDRHSHLASMCGTSVDMGPCAVVRHAGVRILITSRKTPPFDLGQLRSQGIVPESLLVIGVKAAVAHRRAYDPIAKASYSVDTPGPCSSNVRTFPYKHLRRPVFPLDELA